jgi:predicted amidohydrolase
VTRKVHLVPTLEDTLPLTPGDADALRPIPTPCGRVGVLICYDGFAERHTAREPWFRPLGARLAAAGAEIIAQPSANPWPWNERWIFCDAGEHQLRCEQWLREGLFSQLAAMPGVRWVVNPQLLDTLLGSRFDGRSYVFGRDAAGRATIVAAAASDAPAPGSEEVLLVRVPARAEAPTAVAS